jgi:hypothetical protein
VQYNHAVNKRTGTLAALGVALLAAVFGQPATDVAAQTSAPLPSIRTIAGRIGFGDGGGAIDASLPDIKSVSVDSFGRTLIATTFDNRVRRIETDGTINVIAGDGRATQDIPVVGVSATSAALPPINAILGLADGSVLISGGLSVLRLRADGVLESFANSLRAATSSCPSPTTQPPSTTLAACSIDALTVDPAGTVYLASGSNIQAVSAAGVVTRIAGNGTNSSSPGGEGQMADSVAVGPQGIAYANGALYFTDRPSSLRKIGPDGILRTVISSTVIPPLAPGFDARELYAYRVLSSTVAGDVLFYNGFGVGRYRADGVVDSLLGHFFNQADPAAGGLATNAFFGYRLLAAGAPDGSVVIGAGDVNEVYRINTGGVTTRLAGRILGEVEPADRVSLALGRDIAQTADGDTLIVEATASNRVWRLTNGTLRLVLGALRPTAAGASVPSARRRLFSVTRVAEACGSIYFNENRVLERVDAVGTTHPITGPGGSTLSGLVAIGGTCGSLLAINFGSNGIPSLYRIGTDDQAVAIGTVMSTMELPRIGPDGEGGVYVTSGGFLRRYDALGQETTWTFGSVQHAALIPGGLFVTQPPDPGGYLLNQNRLSIATFRSGVLTTIREAPAEFTAIGTAPDGSLADVPVVITSVAANQFPDSKVRVLDRGLLREISLPPARVAAPSVVWSSPPPPRVAATPAVGWSAGPRERAPQAG